MEIKLNISGLHNGLNAYAEIFCHSTAEAVDALAFAKSNFIAFPVAQGGPNQQAAQDTVSVRPGPTPGAQTTAVSTAGASTTAAVAGKPETAAQKKAREKKEADAAAGAKGSDVKTIEEVTATITKYANKFGVPETILLNGRFGVQKAGELKPTQYADFIAFAQTCIDNDKPASEAGKQDDTTDEDAGGTPAGPDMSSLV